jgi:hypothetical protein
MSPCCSGKCFSIKHCALADPESPPEKSLSGAGTKAKADEGQRDHADDPGQQDQSTPPVTKSRQARQNTIPRGSLG